MTYSIHDARIEFAHRIDECVHTRDAHEAYAIATVFAESGDLESADQFRKMARSWDSEDNYHDEVNGN